MIGIQEKYKKYDKKRYFDNYKVGGVVALKGVSENVGVNKN